MKAIILVGGLGTRLRPLTLDRPKPLLPILGRPFLSYQFRMLEKGGIRDICLAVGPIFRPWEKKLRRIRPKGVRLTFSRETKLLGTGGAIRLAADRMGLTRGRDVDAIVLNGDVFLSLDLKAFAAFHRRKRSAATIALTHVRDVSSFGLIDRRTDGRITRFREKSPFHRPGWVNAGAYILSSPFLRSIPRRLCSIERESFPRGLRNGWPMFSVSLRGYWNDIGRPESYLQAHRDLLLRSSAWTDGLLFRKKGAPRRGTGPAVWRGRGVRLHPSSRIQGFASFEAGVHVGKNCVVQDSVLHEGCRIEEGAVIRRSIVGWKSRIGKGATLEGAVLGKGTVVSHRSQA